MHCSLMMKCVVCVAALFQPKIRSRLNVEFHSPCNYDTLHALPNTTLRICYVIAYCKYY